MKLKSTILSVLGRKTLKRLVEDMEIVDVDRRSAGAMRGALSRSRRVTTEDLLEYMRKDEVKAACEVIGVSGEGRRDQLVKRLGSQLVSSIQQAKTTGLDDGTRIKARRKGWVVIDRHGFYLADPHAAAWVGSPSDKKMPPAVFPTAEAAYAAWKQSNEAAQGRAEKMDRVNATTPRTITSSRRPPVGG